MGPVSAFGIVNPIASLGISACLLTDSKTASLSVNRLISHADAHLSTCGLRLVTHNTLEHLIDWEKMENASILT
jgi:hypothetical protein